MEVSKTEKHSILLFKIKEQPKRNVMALAWAETSIFLAIVERMT